MSVRRESISVTGPAGTAVSDKPISGEILEVRVDSTDLSTSPAGSADFTITRVDGGGTILSAANQSPPFTYSPRLPANTTAAGTVAGNPGQLEPIPCDGHVRVVVAQAGTATDDVHIFYRV